VIDRLTQYVLNPFIYLLIALAAVVFLWGLVEFVAKADDPEGRKTGQQHLLWGLVGLAVIAGAYGILNFIQNTLVTLFR
jgi:hypothetical protein